MSVIIKSEIPLKGYAGNLATMLNSNAQKFRQKVLYQEYHDGAYQPLSWQRFQSEVASLQQELLARGLTAGDRVAFLSPNRREMLELELAVMALGAASVPVFAGYTPNWADTLIRFCEPKFIVVADETQLAKISNPQKYSTIIHFDSIRNDQNQNLIPFADLIKPTHSKPVIEGEDIDADTVCLMMYTSGTMGKPKLVQLTHRNILSQQAAMRTLWNLNHTDRFLAYLPWHHSFGGIFEKYAAITNGASLALEHGFGKNIQTLINNWRQIRPTVFFSVPRVYQEIATLVQQDREIENLIFHDELRFIFTAAAPLPKHISDMFENRNIPVVEGWGLTETSPCCTITDPGLPRLAGVVGKPIPGVSLKIADDGEILVKGPNVMTGYFKNPEATDKVLLEDGWFATGDVGEITESGLKLISRKDRIFKLSNAKKVIPTQIENMIVKDCSYLAHAYVAGSSHDHPVALLFPNRALFSKVLQDETMKTGCKCPRNLADLAACLKHCLEECNQLLDFKYYRIESAMLLDYELSIEKEELTPSMKLAPNIIGSVFEANINYLYDPSQPIPEKVYVIPLDQR